MEAYHWVIFFTVSKMQLLPFSWGKGDSVSSFLFVLTLPIRELYYSHLNDDIS